MLRSSVEAGRLIFGMDSRMIRASVDCDSAVVGTPTGLWAVGINQGPGIKSWPFLFQDSIPSPARLSTGDHPLFLFCCGAHRAHARYVIEFRDIVFLRLASRSYHFSDRTTLSSPRFFRARS